MTTLRTAAALVVLVAVPACTESSVGDRETGDLGYAGPYTIDTVSRECATGTRDAWSFSVRTNGWAHAVELEILAPATPEAAEAHPFTNVDYDSAGAWDQWDATLLTATEAAEVQPGETTAWGCADSPSLAFQVVMFATDAPETPIDCVVWGETASLAMAGPGGLVCRCVEEDESCAD